MGFLVEFEGMLYFQGLEGIYGEIVVIFDGVKSDEMLDFSGFARSGYRSDFGDFLEFLSRYMDGTDTLVFAAGNLS